MRAPSAPVRPCAAGARPPPRRESGCVDPRPCGSSLRCVAPRPCGSTLRCIDPRPCGSSLRCVAPRPCGSTLRCIDPRPCGSTLRCVASRPCGSTLRCDASRPCGSTLRCDASRPCGSTLAGVGHRPLANGHGCLVGLRAGVLDRRPVSPLPSSPASSGAGSGWHRLTQIADSTVYLGGPATFGAGPLMCTDSWAVTVWRIASAARLRRSRGHRTERGQPVLSSRRHCGRSLGPAGIWPVPGPSRARSCAVAAQPGTGQRPAPLIRPVACSLLNLPVARSPSAGGAGAGPVPGRHRLGRRDPGAARPEIQAASPEVITVGVHPGHDPSPVRAESARPVPSEQRAQPLSR